MKINVYEIHEDKKDMTTFQQKKQQDIIDILTFIDAHDNRNGMISMFIKGPPHNDGYMFCSREGGSEYHWTESEATGLEEVRMQVIDKGWDSFGYVYMMEILEQTIRDRYPPKPPKQPILSRSIACACICATGGCNGCPRGESIHNIRTHKFQWLRKTEERFNKRNIHN